MAIRRSRRSTLAAVAVVALAGTAWQLACQAIGHHAFLTAAPAARGRTAMRGFKEDFEAWRSALSPEEQKLVQSQAQGEFNKNFRKSAEFKQDLPAEKIKSFGNILGKFFDSESEDYKKDASAKTPDYDGLLKKAGGKKFDFSLKNMIIELDRDADRRYHFAALKIKEAAEKGEKYPQSSPLLEKWGIQNNDTESHNKALEVIEFMKRHMADPSCPPDAKAAYEKAIKQGIPPVGEVFELLLPQVLVNQLHWMNQLVAKATAEKTQNMTASEAQKYTDEEVPLLRFQLTKFIQDNYYKARDEVNKEAEAMKNAFANQKLMPGKTKADVLKEIWAELPKYADKPLPPLDDEVLAELSKYPANPEGEYKHSWGCASRLFKSEAIDAFGQKYLLGIFDTKEEAQQAFDEWNAEYEKARAEMKVELQQFSKQEQARADRDTSGAERIRKVLEESRR